MRFLNTPCWTFLPQWEFRQLSQYSLTFSLSGLVLLLSLQVLMSDHIPCVSVRTVIFPGCSLWLLAADFSSRQLEAEKMLQYLCFVVASSDQLQLLLYSEERKWTFHVLSVTSHSPTPPKKNMNCLPRTCRLRRESSSRKTIDHTQSTHV